MKNLSRLIGLVALLLVAGVILFLSTWDIPAPVVEVEKVIPNEQFPK